LAASHRPNGVLTVPSQQLLHLFEQLAFRPLARTMMLFPKEFNDMKFYYLFHVYLLNFGNIYFEPYHCHDLTLSEWLCYLPPRGSFLLKYG
jgi:hypothetical protein